HPDPLLAGGDDGYSSAHVLGRVSRAAGLEHSLAFPLRRCSANLAAHPGGPAPDDGYAAPRSWQDDPDRLRDGVHPLALSPGYAIAHGGGADAYRSGHGAAIHLPAAAPGGGSFSQR